MFNANQFVKDFNNMEMLKFAINFHKLGKLDVQIIKYLCELPAENYQGVAETKVFYGNFADLARAINYKDQCNVRKACLRLDNIGVLSFWKSGSVARTLPEIKEKKLTCVVHTKSEAEAKVLAEYLPWKNWGRKPSEWWSSYGEQTGYYIENGKLSRLSPINFFIDQYPNYGEVYEFSELFADGGDYVDKIILNKYWMLKVIQMSEFEEIKE